MTKYHVNMNTGAMGVCTAKIKCPLGGDAEGISHFSTQKEAIAASEKILEAQFKPMEGLKKKASNTTKKVDKVKDDSLINSNGISFNKDFTTKPAPAVKIDGYGGYPGFMGSNYAKLVDEDKARTGKNYSYIDSKVIAKHIREDIKKAIETNDLPKNMKYSIVNDGGVNSSSLRIRLSFPNVPIEDMYDYDLQEGPTYRNNMKLKPEFKEVENRVSEITNSYRYDKSNTMVDYFDTNFYSHPSIDDESDIAFNRMDSANKKYQKFINDSYRKSVSSDAVFNSDEYKNLSKEVLDSHYDYNYKSTKKDNAYNYLNKVAYPQRSSSNIPILKENGKIVMNWDYIKLDAEKHADDSKINVQKRLDETKERYEKIFSRKS